MSAGVSFQRLLVPIDLGTGSDIVLRHANLFARLFDAALVLYHAVEVPDHRFAHWAFAQEHEVWMEAERRARDELERRACEIGACVPAIVERATSVHQAIVDQARRTAPDLVVMGTHGREGIAHLLLGSVTEKVLARVRRPILCVRETEHDDVLAYRRILVTTDFSPASRLVFPLTADLARGLGAEIVSIYVARAHSVAGVGGIEPDAVVVPSEALLGKFLSRDFDGLRVRPQIHTGSIWEQIVHTARAEKADLIVMSTRGHDSLADCILGSNTERVVRHAPCPVLVA